MGEVEAVDGVRVADRAVVGVVKQQGEGCMFAMAADGGDQSGFVPLVHNDQVGAMQRLFQVVVAGQDAGAQAWEVGCKRAGGVAALLGEEVGAAPALGRLVGDDVVSACGERAEDAAEKVRVAVVPAGDERMREVDDAHQAARKLVVARLACMGTIRSIIAASV